MYFVQLRIAPQNPKTPSVYLLIQSELMEHVLFCFPDFVVVF